MELAVAPALHRPSSPASGEPLVAKFASYVERSVVTLLDPDRIDMLAEDLRAVQRRRKHHAGLLVCSLILSAFHGPSDIEGRWLDAAVTYRDIGGPDGGMTAFRAFARKLLPVMQTLLRRRMTQIVAEAKTTELRGRLQAFADVLIPDGCAFKLASVLSGISPGTGQPAELKLHAVYSVKAATAQSVTATAGSVHDSDGFWPTWEPGALYIWDLGYQSVERFVDGALAGSHLLQRLKDKHNPIIVATYGPNGARRTIRDADGDRVRLEEALAAGMVHTSEQLDLDVELVDKRRRKVIARVVCVPTDGEDRYYLTTLPRATFTPSDVAELYRVRWEVELFFKNWKGGVRMDHVHRLRNPTSLVVAVTASMLAALLSRDLQVGLAAATDDLLGLAASRATGDVSPCAA